MEGYKRRKKSPSISNGTIVKETQPERQMATRSSTKGGPKLGEVRSKKIKRNIADDT